MTLPNLNSFIYRIQQGTNFSYVEPSSSQAADMQKSVVQIGAGVSNFALVLATLFPAISVPMVITLLDITQPGVGFNVKDVNSGSGFQVRPGAPFSFGASAFPATIYIDNLSASVALQLQVSVTGS